MCKHKMGYVHSCGHSGTRLMVSLYGFFQTRINILSHSFQESWPTMSTKNMITKHIVAVVHMTQGLSLLHSPSTIAQCSTFQSCILAITLLSATFLATTAHNGFLTEVAASVKVLHRFPITGVSPSPVLWSRNVRKSLKCLTLLFLYAAPELLR